MIAISLLAGLLLQAPPPPPPPPPNPFTQGRDATPDRKGSAVIRGHVFTPEGRPLRRAQIRLTSSDVRTPLTTSSGIEGEFELRDLPAVRFTLHVTRSGYLALQYGQPSPGEPGQPIDLADGAVVDKVKITMQRAAVISGRVLDETGEPAAKVDLWAMQEQFFRGRKQLVPMSSATPHISTDESGQYRITGLSPGEYYVLAMTRETWMSDDKDPQMLAFAPTYFPGTADPAEGRKVKVAAGQEVGAIDFSLTSTRTARLSGTATASDGAPMTGSVHLSHGFVGPSGGRISFMGNAKIGADGSWQIADATPGDYTIRATDSRLGDTAARPVTVAGIDIDGLHLSPDPGAIISGGVVTDTGTELPPGRFTFMTIPPQPLEGVAPRTSPGKDDGVVNEEGTFNRRSMSGDVVARLTGLPPGWWLRSVMVQGRDYEGIAMTLSPGAEVSGVTVVITNRFTGVSGTVSGADGRGQPATVLLYPVDPARWLEATTHLKMTRAGDDGRYRFDGVRPGDYFVVAAASVQRSQLADPDLLRALQERAAKITVADTAVVADLGIAR